MKPSTVSNVTLTPNANGVLIAFANATPVRVLLVAISGIVHISYDASALNGGSLQGGASFTLIQDVPSVFILKPGQNLYAASSLGFPNAFLSVAVSESAALKRQPNSAMRPSRINSSLLFTGMQPIAIATAGALPRRVTVVGTNNLGILSDVFVSTVDRFDRAFQVTVPNTFILAPGQTLYASGTNNTFASVADSDVLFSSEEQPRIGTSRRIVGAGSSYSPLARAFEHPLRVLVRNNSAVLAQQLSHDPGAFPAPVSSGSGSETVVAAPATGPGLFSIPPTAGGSVEFYLAPGQALYGGSPGQAYDIYVSATEGDALGYDLCECVCPC
jgi:hypothetical protein